MDFVFSSFSLIEIPTRPAPEQPLPRDSPPGAATYPGREESTHSERCPPKLASRRAWETGMFPSPHSGAQGLYPRESSHHSLCAIHKQPPTHSHTFSLLHRLFAPRFIFHKLFFFYYIDIQTDFGVLLVL